MDSVQDGSHLLITGEASNSVVVMSLKEFESLEETAYLLRSPKNSIRLLESVNQLENGLGTTRVLA
jgi:antitoxin YefM